MVTSIVGSRAFDDQVLGWPAAMDASHSVDEPGITESPEQIFELADAGLEVLSFQDPDDINIELTAPLG